MPAITPLVSLAWAGLTDWSGPGDVELRGESSVPRDEGADDDRGLSGLNQVVIEVDNTTVCRSDRELGDGTRSELEGVSLVS